MDIKQGIEYLKIHGKDIGRKADKGDSNCKNIINLYWLMYKCSSDPGSQGLLLGAIEEYIKIQKEKKMTYDNIRNIKIKIIEALQEWAEEYEIETSAEMEANGAQRIFDNLDGKFKEE